MAYFCSILELVPHSGELSVVVAGARAEASLPPHWWLEGLLAMASAAATTPKDLALRLYFVGPEVPSSTSSAKSKGCTEQLVAHALPPPLCREPFSFSCLYLHPSRCYAGIVP